MARADDETGPVAAIPDGAAERNGSAGPPGSHQWSPLAITSTIVIPLVGIIVGAIVTLSASGSGAPAPGSAAPRAAATATTPAISELQQCMSGLWLEDQGDLPGGTMHMPPDGHEVKVDHRNGSVSVYFGSDGHGKFEQALQLTGAEQGSPIEDDFEGALSFTYVVKDSTVQYLKTANTVQQVLFKNGEKILTVPNDGDPPVQQVACSPGHLVLTDASSTTHYNRP